MKANTIAVTIKCTPEKAFQYISNIKNLLVWAPAFADSITNEGGRWIAKKGKNIFEARIVSDERYGIVDFQIIPAPGVLDVFPSRVVANGPDTEYVFTLFQTPGMDDEVYAQTLEEMLNHELENLKRLLE
jgi:hypothetical protein